jgi:chromosome partitioning protein
MIITVAQQKGGAGKTTLAAQLATVFLSMNKSVATVDTDTQASLTRWAEVRRESFGEADKLTHVQATGWRTDRQVRELAQSNHYVIIDSPPHAETDARLAIRAADIILVPTQPSPLDIWATQATLQLAKAEGIPALVIANRVPPRSSMAEDIVDNLDQLGADVSRVRLGARIAFAESMLNGKGVVESHRLSTAADEIAALAREIIRRTSSMGHHHRKAA